MLWSIIEITVNNDQANETVRPIGVHELVDMILLLFKCSAPILTLGNKEEGSIGQVCMCQNEQHIFPSTARAKPI